MHFFTFWMFDNINVLFYISIFDHMWQDLILLCHILHTTNMSTSPPELQKYRLDATYKSIVLKSQRMC